jgi:hypothetical protein
MPRYSFDELTPDGVCEASSDNPTDAGNQQERLIGWITGFVDGEGCFSIHLVRQPHREKATGLQDRNPGGASVRGDTRREERRVPRNDARLLRRGTSALQSQARQPQRAPVSVRCKQAERSTAKDHSVFSAILVTNRETIGFREIRKVYADH